MNDGQIENYDGDDTEAVKHALFVLIASVVNSGSDGRSFSVKDVVAEGQTLGNFEITVTRVSSNGR